MGTPGRPPGEPQASRAPKPRAKNPDVVRPLRPETGDALDDASWERVRQRVADEATRAAEAPPETRRRPVWLLPLTLAVVAVLGVVALIAIANLR